MTEIEVGQWVVIKRPYSYRTGKVARVMPKTISCVDLSWGSRETRVDRESVLFSGTEKAAHRLAQQLESSAAIFGEDRRKASDRKRERDLKLIGDAAPKAHE